MIKIKKTGTNNYGKWVCFSLVTNFFELNGIAKTDLELEENKDYSDLLLVINQKNNKSYYKIVAKELI